MSLISPNSSIQTLPVAMPQAKQENNAKQASSTPNRAEKTAKPIIKFECQLAHGSPIRLITGFTSPRDLYQKIADCFEIPVEDIIFCTLNTQNVDMTKLLGSRIELDDIINVHLKGRCKHVDIYKTDDLMGLTLADNGAGYVFIKRIQTGSFMDCMEHVAIGDHIERLNDLDMVGMRHFEIVQLLKALPTGSSFTMRLVEPICSGIQTIGACSQSIVPLCACKDLPCVGPVENAQVEHKLEVSAQAGIGTINNLLDSYLGVNDTELATKIWNLGADKPNSMDFAEAIDNSDLESFGLPDDFIIELWGAITDARRKKEAVLSNDTKES